MMSKTKAELVPLLLMVLAVEISMYAFLGVTTPGTSLYDFLVSGSLSSSSNFFSWIKQNMLDIMGLIGIGTIIVGTYISGKSLEVIYAGIALLFLSYVKVFFDFGSIISREINMYSSFNAGGIFSAVIIAPILLLYVMAILKLWRGTD